MNGDRYPLPIRVAIIVGLASVLWVLGIVVGAKILIG